MLVRKLAEKVANQESTMYFLLCNIADVTPHWLIGLTPGIFSFWTKVGRKNFSIHHGIVGYKI